MGTETVNIIGKMSPRSRAAREDVGIGLYPRRVIISSGVNDLETGKPLQSYAEASAASWAKCVVQQSSMIWRAIRVRTVRGPREVDGPAKKNKFYSECAAGGTLAERTMTNRNLHRSSHGSKPYCAAQAPAFMKLLAHRLTPPIFQAEGRRSIGMGTILLNVGFGSFATGAHQPQVVMSAMPPKAEVNLEH